MNNGLEVIHVIHRFGMSNSEALEVEAALIDAYEGLTNIQSGINPERGMMAANLWKQLQELEQYEEPKIDYVLIKVKSNVLSRNNNNLYETTRKAWRADINKARKYKYVVAAVDGIVRKVYTELNWYNSSIPNRVEFKGIECSESWVTDVLGKKIPDLYRKKGAANPFMYKKD